MLWESWRKRSPTTNQEKPWAHRSLRDKTQHNCVAREAQIRCKALNSFWWFWVSIKTNCAFRPSFKVPFLLFISIPAIRSPYPKGLCTFTSLQEPECFGNTARQLSFLVYLHFCPQKKKLLHESCHNSRCCRVQKPCTKRCYRHISARPDHGGQKTPHYTASPWRTPVPSGPSFPTKREFQINPSIESMWTRHQTTLPLLLRSHGISPALQVLPQPPGLSRGSSAHRPSCSAGDFLRRGEFQHYSLSQKGTPFLPSQKKR